MTARPWISRSVVGILLATFFSDVGHELTTAVLPMYLASVGLGPAALGLMEGAADLLFSLSKLCGGFVGHHVERKLPWATAGYLTTSVATATLALARSATALVPLRALAWFGRGFRSPLRDFILADEVGPTHFGRAYGMERSADMLGAVAGPLLALTLLWAGLPLRTVILASLVPSLISVASLAALTRDRAPTSESPVSPSERHLPRAFWSFLVGVFLFGLGDFSRTFLIFLLARRFGTTAIVFYVAHNAVSALVAYPVGRLGDSRDKVRLLLGGYALGVVTNALLAGFAPAAAALAVVVVLSGSYIAVEETLEKAVVAELLPRPARSLGFGILAAANAAGDMLSSVYVGVMLQRGETRLAFALPAAVGALGVVWLAVVRPRLPQAAVPGPR